MTIEVINFGCRLNIAEGEAIRKHWAGGNAVIINSCAVTAEAERQSRQAIRRAAQTSKRVFATGCAVRLDPEAARGWWHGLKIIGSIIPGILTAGTFYEQGGMVFYDVHDPERTIVLDLDHERYKRLIVEVEDPDKTRAMIERVMERAR